MKKILIILFCLALLLTVFSSNACSDALCPINYSCYITHDDNSLPTLHFDFINTSENKIVYIEYSASLYDRNFSPAYDKTGQSHVCRIKISKLSVDGKYAPGNIGTDISAFPDAAHVGEIKSLKIRFENGTVWEKQAAQTSKADFSCLSSYSDGVYTAEDGTLRLCDTSSFSQSREWYYWDDSKMGWVHFSSGLYASFPARGIEACIKLVINGNPDLYCIKTFEVKTASIAATCRESGETLYSTSELMSFATKELNPPFEISLWDFCEAQSEKWYIWSDLTMKWQPFSNERGPSMTVYDKTSLCLKVVYNDDLSNYIIYNIYLK